MNERYELPIIQRLTRFLEFLSQGVGKRKIHIVAAQKNVSSDTDALQFQITVLLRNCHQTEIGGASAYIAHKYNVSRRYVRAPIITRGIEPGVKCGLRFLK